LAYVRFLIRGDVDRDWPLADRNSEAVPRHYVCWVEVACRKQFVYVALSSSAFLFLNCGSTSPLVSWFGTCWYRLFDEILQLLLTTLLLTMPC